jgi:hypothetical protein
MDKKGPGAIRGLKLFDGHPPSIDLTLMLSARLFIVYTRAVTACDEVIQLSFFRRVSGKLDYFAEPAIGRASCDSLALPTLDPESKSRTL